jgi:hypothetical protein
MRTRNKGALTELHFKVPIGLYQSLQDFVRSEGCRSTREIMIYFLQVMLLVLDKQPRLYLQAEPLDRGRMVKELRAWVPSRLYQSLTIIGEKFGMQVPEVSRALLQTALVCHTKLVPRGQAVSKEEFIKLILSAQSTSAK